ncbi:hypothetical protein PPERSA_08739 [Pseudocohnilembus persalinus]|uniref:Palmitoyltransferase n=1 Tax=Pseudocohnilembus persalinus TaxID=266149 RepID=A0A0V0QXV1_PSEPJ|nr:hypothetical protein PPERSA_08739 [Pseudocohnilembus persalinus]|eukprot:KRX07062.1 hypothetical protein PPERSA_08739 [Pseudocohnilembus persalinus]
MIETGVIFFLTTLFGGAFFYLILCVDPNNPGPLGKIHRFIYKYIPDLCSKIIGGENSRISRICGGFFDYLCYKNHPLVQFFYILVAPGGFALYWWVGLSVHFDKNPEISYIHKYIAFFFSMFAFYTYYKVCKVGPGEITNYNVKSYVKKFEHRYDGVLFQKKNECTTCKLEKPARSKHCTVCNMCVSKFDHHCIWIRQCVGEKNYKHFLTFIITHSLLCIYGVYIGLFCFYGIIKQQNLFNAKFRSPNGDIVEASYTIIFKYIFYTETLFVFMIILCGIMGFTLFLFYLYHLTLVKGQYTTNEKIKRSDAMHQIKDRIDEIKEIIKDESVEQKDKEDLIAKLEKLVNQYDKLKEWYPRKSLYQSLKEVYSY